MQTARYLNNSYEAGYPGGSGGFGPPGRANPVRAIIKENLRRCWPVSLVFFLILFCSIILPAYTMKGGYITYASLSLLAMNPFFIIIEIVLPIVAASAVFRYFHTTSGTTLVHSLPLSRRTLFTGSFFSGLILTFAPAVLTLAALSPLYFSIDRSEVSYYLDGNASFVGFWFAGAGITLLILFFMYSLATLAANLTGNGIGLMAITLVLSFITFFVLGIVSAYLDTFLIGFDPMVLQEDIVFRLNPMIFIFGAYGAFDVFDSGIAGFIVTLAVYFAIACAVVAAARFLYKRRKLEYAGRPISFRFAEIIITYLITFVCMAGMGIGFFNANYYSYGFYDSVVDYSAAYLGLAVGCVIGAVVSFMAVTMLAQKTPRIFSKKTLKSFGLFAVIGAIFITFTVFDLTGYTNRVPNPETVRAAEMTLSRSPFLYPYNGLYSYRTQNQMKVEAFSDEDIQALTMFHRGLIENEKAYRGNYGSPVAGSETIEGVYTYDSDPNWAGNVSFVYSLRGPFDLYRSYDFHSGYSNAGLRETLAAMPAFREAITLEKLFGYENIWGFAVENVDDYDGDFLRNYYYDYYEDDFSDDLKMSRPEVLELAKALDNDLRRLETPELAGTAITGPDEMYILRIETRRPSIGNSEGYYTEYIGYIVISSYTESLKILDRYAG